MSGWSAAVPSQHPAMMLVHPDNLKARVATHVLEAPVVLHVVYVIEEQHVGPVTHRLSQRGELQPPRAACRIEEHQRIGIAHFEEEFHKEPFAAVVQPAIDGIQLYRRGGCLLACEHRVDGKQSRESARTPNDLTGLVSRALGRVKRHG